MSDAKSLENANPYGVFHHGIATLSKILVVLAAFVVLLGGKTKSKEAGLTIADPVTFQWVPEWLTTENISAEYTHRILAFLLACTTLALTAWVLKVERRGYVRKLAIAAFIGVIVQAVLGALTVKYLTRAQVSIPHAVVGQTFFAIACCLACVTSKTWTSPNPPISDERTPSTRKLAVWLMVAMFIQLLLGSALRHDNKSEAMREGREIIFISHLVAHFLGAVFVIYRVVLVAIRVLKDHADLKPLKTPCMAIIHLLTLQFALGVAAAILKAIYGMSYELSNAPPMSRVIVATTHQLVGAIILGYSAALTVYAYRLLAPKSASSAPTPAPSTQSGGGTLEISA
jgi:heme A synthase